VFLNNVKVHWTIMKQKEAAKMNESTIEKPLIPIDFDCILIAVLHIILGVTKKLWDLLICDVQKIE